ncbi:UNVERIFIED_CONTAM: hypothetical protein GTU68_041577 [Idotea baltica]|nr:hypothetical protein [Idotea baltica]
MMPDHALRHMTRDELRSVDRRAIDEFGMSGLVLMENAGRNAATLIANRIRSPRQNVCIVCGKGNNAGDGFVIARHLELAGFRAQVFLLEAPTSFSHDARVNHDILGKSGHSITLIDNAKQLVELVDALMVADIVVDALTGTGLKGTARGQIAEGIRCVNQARDIPSGMDCDSGYTDDQSKPPNCIQADTTITLVAAKVGFRMADSRQYLGEVLTAGIGVPLQLLNEFNK